MPKSFIPLTCAHDEDTFYVRASEIIAVFPTSGDQPATAVHLRKNLWFDVKESVQHIINWIEKEEQ